MTNRDLKRLTILKIKRNVQPIRDLWEGMSETLDDNYTILWL